LNAKFEIELLEDVKKIMFIEYRADLHSITAGAFKKENGSDVLLKQNWRKNYAIAEKNITNERITNSIDQVVSSEELEAVGFFVLSWKGKPKAKNFELEFSRIIEEEYEMEMDSHYTRESIKAEKEFKHSTRTKMMSYLSGRDPWY